MQFSFHPFPPTISVKNQPAARTISSSRSTSPPEHLIVDSAVRRLRLGRADHQWVSVARDALCL